MSIVSGETFTALILHWTEFWKVKLVKLLPAFKQRTFRPLSFVSENPFWNAYFNFRDWTLFSLILEYECLASHHMNDLVRKTESYEEKSYKTKTKESYK